MGNTDTKYYHQSTLIHRCLRVIPSPSRAAILEQNPYIAVHKHSADVEKMDTRSNIPVYLRTDYVACSDILIRSRDVPYQIQATRIIEQDLRCVRSS